MFVSTLEIITRLRAFLESLKAPSGEPLFELVRCYDSTQIEHAFADLLVENQRRVCLVLPGRCAYEHAREGLKLRVAKAPQFQLLICDTDRENGSAALLGGPENIGVVALADLVADALAGKNLGLPFVALAPVEGDDLQVYDTSKPGDPGRKGWLLTLETFAGAAHISVPPVRG
ncbi:MAG: hypothetical protein LBC18_03315 [Opitutaceae bacterium]|jgi:hypothetical protein|nr:hypothetical protein [Opitutaceae bacterium]